MSLFSSLSSKDPQKQARIWRKIMEYSLLIAIPFIILSFEKSFLWLIPSILFISIGSFAMHKSSQHPYYRSRE